MDHYTDNEDRDAEFHSILIGRIPPQLEPQTARCDLPNDGNNNTLAGSRGNTTNCNRSFGTPRITVLDLIFLFGSLLGHLYDVVTDIYLAVEYFASQETVYGWLTLAFKIIPAIPCTWISSRMHDEDSQKIIERKTNFVVDILFQLILPLRSLCSLRYAWKVRQCKQKGDDDGLNRYYPKMLKEQADLALLHVIKSFLESAPQLVLQLTILLMEDRAMTTTMWFKIVGGCVTLVCLGWSMRNYHRAIRLGQPDKDVITGFGKALLFIWYFGTIAARIFVIAIAASISVPYTLLARTFIWMGWTIYLYNVDGVFVFCRNKTVSPLLPRTLPEKMRTSFFATVLAVVFIFTFVNLEEGRTRIRYAIYYVLCGLEHITVLAFWVEFASQCCKDVWFSESLLILSVVFFMIGILALVNYYFFRSRTVQNRFFMSSTPIVSQQV